MLIWDTEQSEVEWLPLGAVSGDVHVVLIHGGQSTVPKLEAALPGAHVTVIYRKGLSEVYDEKTGLAKDYPTLEALLAEFDPSWSPGTPLVIFGYSAGGWALRYYLRDPGARQSINAAIFLDSLYGAPNGQCNLAPYDGVIEYAKLANQDPSSHRLIMTYSLATPAPSICSETIAKKFEGPGVFVKGYQNGDHGAQQGVAGPEALKLFVAPWIGGASTSSGVASQFPWAAAAGIGLLVVAGILWWRSG